MHISNVNHIIQSSIRSKHYYEQNLVILFEPLNSAGFINQLSNLIA